MDQNTEIHPQQQEYRQQQYHQQQQEYRPVTMPYFSGQPVDDSLPSDLVIENKNVQHYQQYQQHPNQQVYYTREVYYPPQEPTHQYNYTRQEFTHGGQVPTTQTQSTNIGKQFPGRIDIPLTRQQQQPTRPAYPDPQNKSAILDEIQAIENGYADESVYRQEIPIGNLNKLSVSETQQPTSQTEHWVHEQTNVHRQRQQSPSPPRQQYQSYPDSYQQYGGYPYEHGRYETNFSSQHGNRPEDIAQPPYEQHHYQPYQQQHMQDQHFQHITTEDTSWGKSGLYDGAIPSGPPPVFTTGPQVSPPVSYRTAAQMRRAESEKARRHHSPIEGAAEQGYLFGGMDFIDHAVPPESTNPQDYELPGSEHRSRRATTGSPGPPRRPGDYYGLDYTVFIPGEQPLPAGDEENYKGYKAQKPRKHWHFSADPQATTLNNFEVEVVEGVDPVRLVGDTLSNQKVPVERELTEEEKNNFCTTFAPPTGFKPDHRTVRPEPQSPEPVCYSLSVKKHLATDQSSTPGSQQQTCLPNRGQPLSGQNSSWYATGNKEIMRNEPNWARNVNQRRYAWENHARSADSRLYLPSWAKVPPTQPPPWANRANTTHNKWQTAANRGYIASGNYNTGYNYTVSDSTGGGQHEPQEVPTKTIYYNQPLPHQEKMHAATNQQYQQQEQNPKTENQQTKQSDEIEIQVEPQEDLQQSNQSIIKQQQQQTTFARSQEPPAQMIQQVNQGQIRPQQQQQQQQRVVQQQQAPPQNWQQRNQTVQQNVQQRPQQPSGQQWQQQTGTVTQTTSQHQLQGQQPQTVYQQSQANRYPQQSAAPQNLTQYHGQAQPQSPTKQQIRDIQPQSQSQNQVVPQPAQKQGNYFRNQLNQPLSNTRPGSIKTANAASAGNPPQSKEIIQGSIQRLSQNPPQNIQQSDDYNVNVKDETNYSSQPYGADSQSYVIQHQQKITHHGQSNQSQHPHQQQPYYSSVQQQYYSPQPQRRIVQQQQPTQQQQRQQNIATTRQQQREAWFTGQPVATSHQPSSNVQQQTRQSQQSQQNPQYQIRAEMSENLPPGQLSYSYANASGNFPDKEGHGYVNYSREVSTATNPGQEWQLLKQQESRVVEEPIAEEPGMMTSF